MKLLKRRNYLETLQAKIIKNKNGENVPHLKINEVVLIHCQKSVIKNQEQKTPETMKLLGSTKSKKAEDNNGANVPHL